MIKIVAIKREENIITPDLPDSVEYTVLHYDIENNQVSVRINNNPNNEVINSIGE